MSILVQSGAVAALGVVGAIASTAGRFLSRTVYDITEKTEEEARKASGKSFDKPAKGMALTAHLDLISFEDQKKIYSVANRIRKVVVIPHSLLKTAFKNASDRTKRTVMELHSICIAPIAEEVTYRTLFQGVPIALLGATGSTSIIAKIAVSALSATASNTVFTYAHNPDPTSDAFSAIFIQGAVFAATYSVTGELTCSGMEPGVVSEAIKAVAGTFGAMIAHSVNNLVLNKILGW